MMETVYVITDVCGTNCKNCGAPLKKFSCDYCGTQFQRTLQTQTFAREDVAENVNKTATGMMIAMENACLKSGTLGDLYQRLSIVYPTR